MKNYVFLFILIAHSCFGQNDSLIPNYEAGFNIRTWQINNDPGHEWGEQFIGFINLNYNDTLEVYVGPNHAGWIVPFENKVYFKSMQGSQWPWFTNPSPSFEVLYDYDLQVGDTAYFDVSYQSFATITSIDTYDMEGHLVPYFHLSNGDDWIKGIGSTHHPFYPIVPQFEILYIYCEAMLSYIGDSTFYNYFFEGPDYDFCHFGMDELLEKKKGVMLFPNPTQSMVAVSGINESSFVIELFDAQGMLISKIHNQSNIDLGGYNSGIYLVKVTTDHSVEQLKLIKE